MCQGVLSLPVCIHVCVCVWVGLGKGEVNWSGVSVWCQHYSPPCPLLLPPSLGNNSEVREGGAGSHCEKTHKKKKACCPLWVSALWHNFTGILLPSPHPSSPSPPSPTPNLWLHLWELQLLTSPSPHFIFFPLAATWVFLWKEGRGFRACGLIEIIFAVLRCLPGSILP